MSDAHGTFYRSNDPYSDDDLPHQLFLDGKPLTVRCCSMPRVAELRTTPRKSGRR